MIHVVQAGETIYRIAQDYGVSQARIRSDNGLLPEQILVPGQALVILRPEETYQVQAGDNLYQIAGKTGSSVLQLLRLNPVLAQGQPIRSGQILTVRLQEDKAPLGIFTVNGYVYPHIQISVLRQALPYLSVMLVFSCGFRENGSLILPDDRMLLAEARDYPVAPVLVLSSVDESGMFSSERASRLFRNEKLQEQVLEQLIQVMIQRGYTGLDADFEYITAEDAESYLAFLNAAREKLHTRGLFLQADLAPKTYAQQPGLLYEAHNYPVVGALADSVLLMTYEWGYAYGPPMAVAPLPQVSNVLRYGVSEIPSGKIDMGIPNYGYDWAIPYQQGTRAVTIGNQEAVLLASRVGARIAYDKSAQSPYFDYQRHGEQHRVWFEDARSILAKLRMASEWNLRGIAYWNLLRPFAQNWALVSRTVDIRQVQMGYF